MPDSLAIDSSLNPEQARAVRAEPGPVLVLAGPGSGKTRVLTLRAAYLVEELAIPPWQIMAVTFTNKAAREMSARLDKLIGEEWSKDLAKGTFHALCARYLRREAARGRLAFGPNYVIYDTADQLRVVKRVFEELNVDTEQHDLRVVHAQISNAKNQLTLPDSFVARSYPEEIVARVYRRYHELLRGANALDFDDLLLEMALLLERDEDARGYYQQRYRHVLVDEFQDTNAAQYALLKHLVQSPDPEHERNLFVVGDEDQSIYSWRGADSGNVRRFKRDFPKAQVIVLERNYRSTQTILDAARAVIDRNTDRTAKALWTDLGAGEKLVFFEAYNEAEEAAYIVRQIQSLSTRGEPLGEMAVMYRTNSQSRAVEDVLVRYRIPYQIVGGTRFYDRREVKDVLAYLRLLQNTADDVAFERIVNVPPRGIGPVALSSLYELVEVTGGSLFDALRSVLNEEPLPPGVSSADTRSRNALAAFRDVFERLLGAVDELSVPDLLAFVLAETGYIDWLRSGQNKAESEERVENVRELRGVAEDFASYPPREGLTALLESVALVADVDDLPESTDRITLMTLHSAKGLEFDTVFLSGLEEGLLPHQRSLEDDEGISEERRLFYVGLTRAKRRLFMLRTFRRGMYGSSEPRSPSRFLSDIPERLLETTGSSVADRSRPARPDRTVWHTEVAAQRTARSTTIAGDFKAGDRVRHKVFGEGVVVNAKAIEGDEEVTVAFEGMGVKKLLQSFAQLERANSRS